jgi:hypothetical protein
LILHIQHGMHWWHCGMQSKGCCKSSAEQLGIFPMFTSCDEQATRCAHDTLVQQPGCRWCGKS